MNKDIEKLEQELYVAEEVVCKLKRQIFEKQLEEIFHKYPDLGSISWQNIWDGYDLLIESSSIEMYNAQDVALRNRMCLKEVVSVLDSMEEDTLLDILNTEGEIEVEFDRENNLLSFATTPS